MKIQQRTYDRILLNLHAVEAMFNKEKVEYDSSDFREVSREVGISVSRIKRAYENLSEFGFVNLSLGELSNAEVVPNKPVRRSGRITRRNVNNNYIKRKDENYVEVAKHIIHDRIFTNMTVQEIANRWNCSKGRVNNLVSEVARYGAIKLPKFRKHVLIDITKYRDVDVRKMIGAIKMGIEYNTSLEKKLRHKLLTRVLREALTFNG